MSNLKTQPIFNFQISTDALEALAWFNDKTVECDDWLAGAFKDKAYLKELEVISSTIKKLGIPPKSVPAFVLTWMSYRRRTSFQQELEYVVESYNRYGPRFTAWLYCFGRNHRFEWLPETGQVVELGYMLHKASGRVVRVPDEHRHKFRDQLLKRRLRRAPDLEALVLSRPPRPYRRKANLPDNP